jgi:hypothetical protein
MANRKSAKNPLNYGVKFSHYGCGRDGYAARPTPAIKLSNLEQSSYRNLYELEPSLITPELNQFRRTVNTYNLEPNRIPPELHPVRPNLLLLRT